MLKLEPPAEYYIERKMGTQNERSTMEPQVYYREKQISPKIQTKHYDYGVSSSQVESVVSGIMHTHIDDFQANNCPCRRPDNSTVDSPEGHAKMLHSLLALQQRQQQVETESVMQQKDSASLPGESDGPRTTSPLSIGSVSRGSSFSRNRVAMSVSPSLSTSSLSTNSLAVPLDDISKSKLYSMLQARSNNSNSDYPYPSAASAAAGVGPYIHTPPGFYRNSCRSNSFSNSRQQPDMYPSSMSSSLVRHVREKVCYTPPPDEAQQDFSSFRKRSYSATVPRSARLHEERPIDLSFKRPKTLLELPTDVNRDGCSSQPCSTPTIAEQSTDTPSILRTMLCGRLKKIVAPTKQNNENGDYPPHTVVSLAKKNLLPVSARISDWLVKLVEFALALPEFSDLAHDDKVTLIQSSWSRIVLLYMAETSFQFVVTPTGSEGIHSPGATIPAQNDPTVPTMKRVENMQSYINKCQSLTLDAEEYECLRIMTLFSSQSGKLFNIIYMKHKPQSIYLCHYIHFEFDNINQPEPIQYTSIHNHCIQYFLSGWVKNVH